MRHNRLLLSSLRIHVGAKLSTIQTERKSPWNWDLENLKSVWAAKNLTPPTHG
jgi:hypothetical protein